MKPNDRERKVLENFVGNIPESWDAFPGAGEVTKSSLLKNGWIQENQDTDYPADYYQITEAGNDVI